MHARFEAHERIDHRRNQARGLVTIGRLAGNPQKIIAVTGFHPDESFHRTDRIGIDFRFVLENGQLAHAGRRHRHRHHRAGGEQLLLRSSKDLPLAAVEPRGRSTAGLDKKFRRCRIERRLRAADQRPRRSSQRGSSRQPTATAAAATARTADSRHGDLSPTQARPRHRFQSGEAEDPHQWFCSACAPLSGAAEAIG